MRQDQVLFQSGDYRVVLHGAPEHPATIVAFQPFGPFVATPEQPFPGFFLPEKMIRSETPVNFVSFQASRNDWYCGDDADRAAQILAAVLEGTRVVTYGISMGGFAAINLAGQLNATRFLALAPQSTVFHPFMGSIGDSRFVEDIDPFRPHHDHISDGELHDREGLIIFDSHQKFDLAHAGRAATLTRASLLDLPYTGHHVGVMLNRVFPLRKVMMAMTRKHFDVVALRGEIEAVMSRQPERMATRPETFASFLALARKTGAAISGQALYNAVRCLKIYREGWTVEPGFAEALAEVQALLAGKGQQWVEYEAWMPGYLAKVLKGIEGGARSAPPGRVRRPGSRPPP